MPKKKHNHNKARGSFPIPKKFRSHLTLVLRWTLLTVEKENYDKIYENFNEEPNDQDNQHNDLMEEVPDDESSEYHLIVEGTENQLEGEFDFKTMRDETIISNEFIFDAATVEDHNETENDDVDVTKTV